MLCPCASKLLEQTELDRHRLQKLDISLPGRDGERGNIHPITRALERVSLRSLRGSVTSVLTAGDRTTGITLRGAEFPAAPSGAMHDTFCFGDGRLLRTYVAGADPCDAGRQPPIRIIAPGKVYRSDSDQTHSPMFHQIEGLLVDETSSFADLKGTLAVIRAERDFRDAFPA